MSVETIFKIALHPFVTESLSNLKTMTSHSGQAGAAFVDSAAQFDFSGFGVATEISGSLDGAILMHHAEDTAVAIGNDVSASMLGEQASHTAMSAELGMVLAEWGNTIIGRATEFLARHNLGFEFTAPTFVNSAEQVQQYMAGVEHMVSVPIEVDGIGVYHVHLLVRGGSYERLMNAKGGESSGGGDEAGNGFESDTVAIRNTATTPLPLGSTIMLVDDSTLIRKAVRRLLSGLGYINVVEASDGSEAVEHVAAGGIDFIIMDLVMEKMNGDEALARIRQMTETLPVLMLSSVTDHSVVQRCQRLGISGFILKPMNRDTGPQVLAENLKV